MTYLNKMSIDDNVGEVLHVNEDFFRSMQGLIREDYLKIVKRELEKYRGKTVLFHSPSEFPIDVRPMYKDVREIVIQGAAKLGIRLKFADGYDAEVMRQVLGGRNVSGNMSDGYRFIRRE